MRKIFALALTVLTVFGICGSGEFRADAWATGGVYRNKVDGYCFTMPAGFAPNYSFYPTAMIFESADTDIEIYAQECKSKAERLSYISYSNKAITNNKIDYRDVSMFTDYQYNTVLRWSRNKLSRIEKDRNYYLKIDIPTEHKVYTMLLKSTEPLEHYKNYLSLISFHNDIEPVGELPKKLPRVPHFNDETQAFYEKYFSDSAKLSWGIFHPGYMQGDSLKVYENEINSEFDVALWYMGLYKDYSREREMGILEKAYADGKTVELTLQPLLAHQAGNDLFRLMDGYYDDFLDKYAADIARFGHPVMFRFANEMNGDWCEYSGYQMSMDTRIYREMYRYVCGFFEKHNADNVILVWNPNGRSFPPYKWNAEEMYYPGNDYVDILGLTLYNTGTFYEGEKWTSFENLYDPLYKNAVQKYDMPFMITEFACARVGGNKEEWTRDMLRRIEGYTNVKMAVWWNGVDYASDGSISRMYYIADSPEMKEIFRDYFSQKSKQAQ